MQLAPCAASAAAARCKPRTTVDTRETRPLRTQGASCSGPSSHNFRDLKRAVPSAPSSTSPLRRALLTKRVRPPHEVLYKLRRENPQIWLIRTETRENKIVSTTIQLHVHMLYRSSNQLSKATKNQRLHAADQRVTISFPVPRKTLKNPAQEGSLVWRRPLG